VYECDDKNQSPPVVVLGQVTFTVTSPWEYFYAAIPSVCSVLVSPSTTPQVCTCPCTVWVQGPLVLVTCVQ